MAAKRKRGRPTKYTRAISDEICERLARGETLNQICAKDHMPARPTVIGWDLEDRDGFSDRYAHARQRLLDFWADQVVDIADDGEKDVTTRKRADGSEYDVVNGEVVNRSRLRVDTRKWLLSKLKPGQYGDRMKHEHGGDEGGPIVLKFSEAVGGILEDDGVDEA